MKKKYYLLLLIIIKLNAQNNNSATPLHYPMAASVWDFAKYGNIPIDEYRGLANINIPLYNINVDKIEIPLQLSYYSGGIRVSEEASVVGLGWNFNLPTLIQEVKDKVDYDTRTTHQRLPPFQGNPALPDSGLYLMSNMEGFTNPLTEYYPLPQIDEMPYFTNVVQKRIIDHNGHIDLNWKYGEMFEPTNRIVDTEPDIFKVSINGVEIKFCRVQSSQEQITNNPLEILPVKIINGRTEYKVELLIYNVEISTYQTLAVGGFKITDPNGSIYFFDKIEQIQIGGGSPSNYIYKLTKIISNLNKEINFTYLPLVNITEPSLISAKYTKLTSPVNVSFVDVTTATFYTSLYQNSPIICGIGGYCSNSITNNQSIHYLSSISTPSETISLEYENRLDNITKKRLKSLEIKNIFNEKIKKFSFGYDYFISDTGTDKRLKLISLTEEGNEPYKFDYNPINLPNKNSFSIDYWGFYNGYPNLNLKPDLTDLGYPQYTENINNNFNSNIYYTKACSLEKITYPTKGYTTFEYETHLFDNLLFNSGGNTPIINNGGGLRIKNITNFNYNDDIINKTNYDYYGGKCISKRVLTKAIEDRNFQDHEINTFTQSVIMCSINNFVNSSTNSEEAYIGYDKVVIKNIGTFDNGKIEKSYSNTPNYAINPSNTFNYDAYTYTKINNLENGKILEEKIIDNQNNLIKQTKYKYYNEVFDEDFYGIAKQPNGYGIKSTAAGGSYNYYYFPRTLAVFYAIRGKTTFLKSEEATEYFDSSSISKTISYTRDSKNMLTDVITNSGQEYNSLSSESTRMAYQDNSFYSSKNLFSLPLSQTISENGIIKEIKQFEYLNTENSTLIKSMSILPNQNVSNEIINKINYDLYDEKNNIIQYHQENGINICIIWGYNKTLPIAKIENINYSQISTYVSNIQNLSNINNEVNLLLALDSFRISILAQYPNSRVTTYTHKPLIGVSTITDTKGDKAIYNYDTFGKLINVKDKDNNILSENEYHFKQ